jgi:hypothetical protein
MVTQEKIISNTALRYRLGTVLIWLGVFAWLPFLFLRAIGEKPPFLLFLAFHLIGVVGGARLRSVARKKLGIPRLEKNLLSIAGHTIILLGILAWAPYLYIKIVLGRSVDVMNYLPYHLTGVFGGVLLHILNYAMGHFRKGGTS